MPLGEKIPRQLFCTYPRGSLAELNLVTNYRNLLVSSNLLACLPFCICCSCPCTSQIKILYSNIASRSASGTTSNFKNISIRVQLRKRIYPRWFSARDTVEIWTKLRKQTKGSEVPRDLESGKTLLSPGLTRQWVQMLFQELPSWRDGSPFER